MAKTAPSPHPFSIKVRMNLANAGSRLMKSYWHQDESIIVYLRVAIDWRLSLRSSRRVAEYARGDSESEMRRLILLSAELPPKASGCLAPVSHPDCGIADVSPRRQAATRSLDCRGPGWTSRHAIEPVDCREDRSDVQKAQYATFHGKMPRRRDLGTVSDCRVKLPVSGKLWLII